MSLADSLDTVQKKAREWVAANKPPRDDAVRVYYETDRSFEKKGGVVKVSHLLAAMHLACARWMFRALPSMIKTRVEIAVLKNGAKLAAKQAVKTALGTTPGLNVILGLAGDLGDESADVAAAREVELQIRQAVGFVRREFNDDAKLPQCAKRGEIRDVQSRHETKPKRRQAPWRSR